MNFQLLNMSINPLVMALLRSPLHRVLSGSLLVLTYTGRKTGRRHSLPVMYAERSGEIVVFSGRPREKRWWRNFRGGAEVEIVLRGERRTGHAQVIAEDPASAPAAVAAYTAKFPAVAAQLRAGAEGVLVGIRLDAAAASA